MLNEKDLISINSRFSDGNVVNSSSLKYTVNYVGRSSNWIKSLACLIRAILIDHIFEDGNKRTTAAIIAYYLEEKDYNYNIDEINKLIIKVIKKNIKNIEEIERLIENVTKSSATEN
ncbi:Fic family protein [Candidatus Woesearchaeota archaeon]|nr:Fic family protein [Candidatus Woesearchaeota archaeon]